MHEVLVNRLGGLSLPRKSVVRLTDRPDMTLDVYRGRKTTNQQHLPLLLFCPPMPMFSILPIVNPLKCTAFTVLIYCAKVVIFSKKKKKNLNMYICLQLFMSYYLPVHELLFSHTTNKGRCVFRVCVCM